MVSRFLRLAPLYYAVVGLLLAIVVWQSKGHFFEAPLNVFKQVVHWSLFTYTYEPSINLYKYTGIIIAKVNWSLPYEWMFYFCLPLFGILIGKLKVKLLFVLSGLMAIAIYYHFNEFEQHHWYSFAGGAIAPFIIKYWPNYKKYFSSPALGILVIAILGAIVLFPTPNNLGCKLLITLLFTLIALGQSVFGLLKTSFLKFLGEICYSTYLWHGMLLFILFKLLHPHLASKPLTPFVFSMYIMGLTPIVVLVSFFSYKYIEKPFIDLGKKISKKD